MTRFARFLDQSSNSSPKKALVADPPETVDVEPDMVVILAALLCALICVIGLILVARCAWLRRGPAGSVDGGGRRRSSFRRGLKKKVIQSLPKYTHDSTANMESVDPAAAAASTECAICLSDYVDGDEIRILPHCGHRFHVSCIDTWLGSQSSCPSCRQVLVFTRCRKCGDYPAVSCGGAGEGEIKGGVGGEGSCG
ncbi:RING-H2 finger protein ATL8-like [Impatiens glandulifera]|uniref:RING-H2 finger protein ATL8-like n=1 Tax=Impatiens glandulifera TaxID=253017 RepID=UPI001FB10131|nr:RING-H2 finger protein ATL8-like [Impatiens glandulifera]